MLRLVLLLAVLCALSVSQAGRIHFPFARNLTTRSDADQGCQHDGPYKIRKPFLSVVFTTQAGTYGDQTGEHRTRRATLRLWRMLWWIGECARRYNVSVEVVIMAWPIEEETSVRQNILDGMKAEGLQLPDSLLQLRILEGPKELLSRNRDSLPVLEYFGKNIAARRAFGDLILLGGTDSLPHETFYEFLASSHFPGAIDIHRASCYGSIRLQTEADAPADATFEEYIQWRDAQEWKPEHRKYEGPPLVERGQLLGHKNRRWLAAGDFTMCTRSGLGRSRGYLETSNRLHVDTQFLYHLWGCGVPTYYLHTSMSSFHQMHDRASGIIRPHEIKLDWNATKRCDHYNSNEWGLPNMSMREYLFSQGKGEWLPNNCVPSHWHYTG